MIALISILFVFLFIGGWILFMPLVIDVDTDRTIYRMYQAGTFQFWLEKDFQPRLRVLGVSVSMKKQNVHKPEGEHLDKRKMKDVSIHRIQVLVRKAFDSICIKRFHLDIDTGDVVLNVQLVPALMLLSRGPMQLTMNFEGRVYASLLAEVRLYRLAWALVGFFTKK